MGTKRTKFDQAQIYRTKKRAGAGRCCGNTTRCDWQTANGQRHHGRSTRQQWIVISAQQTLASVISVHRSIAETVARLYIVSLSVDSMENPCTGCTKSFLILQETLLLPQCCPFLSRQLRSWYRFTFFQCTVYDLFSMYNSTGTQVFEPLLN